MGQAAAWYRQALALDLGLSAAWGNLGECLRLQGNVREAELTLIEGLSLNRDAPALLHNLAVVLEAKGELDAAEQVCRRMLALLPAGHVGAFNTLGVVAFRRGMVAAAEAWWRQALALDPANGDAGRNLAVASAWNQQLPHAVDAC